MTSQICVTSSELELVNKCILSHLVLWWNLFNVYSMYCIKIISTCIKCSNDVCWEISSWEGGHCIFPYFLAGRSVPRGWNNQTAPQKHVGTGDSIHPSIPFKLTRIDIIHSINVLWDALSIEKNRAKTVQQLAVHFHLLWRLLIALRDSSKLMHPSIRPLVFYLDLREIWQLGNHELGWIAWQTTGKSWENHQYPWMSMNHVQHKRLKHLRPCKKWINMIQHGIAILRTPMKTPGLKPIHGKKTWLVHLQNPVKGNKGAQSARVYHYLLCSL